MSFLINSNNTNITLQTSKKSVPIYLNGIYRTKEGGKYGKIHLIEISEGDIIKLSEKLAGEFFFTRDQRIPRSPLYREPTPHVRFNVTKYLERSNEEILKANENKEVNVVIDFSVYDFKKFENGKESQQYGITGSLSIIQNIKNAMNLSNVIQL